MERIRGFSSAFRPPTDEAEPHPAVYVRGDAARQGIGTALLQAAEAALLGMGVREIAIDASLNAVAPYARAGYADLGLREYATSGGMGMASVRMAKRPSVGG